MTLLPAHWQELNKPIPQSHPISDQLLQICSISMSLDEVQKRTPQQQPATPNKGDQHKTCWTFRFCGYETTVFTHNRVCKQRDKQGRSNNKKRKTNRNPQPSARWHQNPLDSTFHQPNAHTASTQVIDTKGIALQSMMQPQDAHPAPHLCARYCFTQGSGPFVVCIASHRRDHTGPMRPRCTQSELKKRIQIKKWKHGTGVYKET